jgi:hypothetical protein
MQLPNEQGVSKGGMQSHFGMRIRYDIVEIYQQARCLIIAFTIMFKRFV